MLYTSLKPLDIEAMKNLGEVANLVPVIGKSDSLTPEERQDFKKRVPSPFLSRPFQPHHLVSYNLLFIFIIFSFWM